MLTITLPFPPSELMPNRRIGQHWGVAASAKKVAREEGFYLAKQAAAATKWSAGDGYIPLSVMYVMPDARRRDADNLLAASKAHLDGLASALGLDDHLFKPILVDWVAGSGKGKTIVTVGVQIQTAMEVA